MKSMTMTDADASIIHPLINPEEAEEAPKREHLCFGCCCNSRESVIAVQVLLGMVWDLATFIGYYAGSYKHWTSDPQLQKELDDAYFKVSIISVVAILVAVVVIAGAVMYNIYLVSLGIVYTIIQHTLETIILFPVIYGHVPYPYVYIIWPLISGLLVLYPHVVFVYEVKKGILMNPNVNLRADDESIFL